MPVVTALNMIACVLASPAHSSVPLDNPGKGVLIIVYTITREASGRPQRKGTFHVYTSGLQTFLTVQSIIKSFEHIPPIQA